MPQMEDNLFAKRLEEQIARAENRGEIVVSDFLDVHQQTLAQELLKYAPCSYFWSGGYEEAERRRLVMHPEYLAADESWAEIAVLDLEGNFSYSKASHRDYLGAILSVGIKREKMGDILVRDDGAYVFLAESIATYILNNLPKVKGVSVKAKQITPQEVTLPENKQKELNLTCASLRLDVILAGGFNLSRSQANDLIQAKKVQVNHQEIADNDYRCEEGEIISVRTKGRIKIAEISGNTKKGKIKIKLIKYGG